MTLKRWDGAAYQDIAAIKRWDGSSWITLTTLKRWDGAAWVDITLPGGGGGALSATCDYTTIGKFNVDPEPAPPFKILQTLTATVTATGGTGPYTYAWTRVSGSSAVEATQPAAAATEFTATVAKNSDITAVMRCTITDSAAAVRTINVTVNFSYSNAA